MAYAVFGIVAALLCAGGEEVVDVPVGHLNAILDLALLNAALDEFVADFFAKAGKVVTITGENVAELAQTQVVLPGDIGNLSVESFVVDTDARAGRHLHLQAIENQLLEDLLLQDVGGGGRYAGVLQALDNGVQTRAHFAVDDDVVVDYRHDPVDFNDLRRCNLGPDPGGHSQTRDQADNQAGYQTGRR